MPNRDTLVVVDCAASKSVAGQPAFTWIESLLLRANLQRTEDQERLPRIRVVLADRTDHGALWTNWKNSEMAADLDRSTLSIELAPNRAEFDAIVGEELVRRLRRPPLPAERQAVESLAERLRDQFRPLFGLLTAAAIVESPTGATLQWSPELLVESILKGQVRQWQRAGVSDDQLDLLYEATLTQGACFESSAFVSRVEALSATALASLATLSESGQRLGPVVPDLLGEFFVLMRLRGEATTESRQLQVTAATAKKP
jgi:hypothetical protein